MKGVYNMFKCLLMTLKHVNDILWQMNHVSYLELIQSAEFAFYSFSL